MTTYNEPVSYNHAYLTYNGEITGSQSGDVEQSFGASQTVTDLDDDNHSVAAVLS